jgi:hypothetical protein
MVGIAPPPAWSRLHPTGRISRPSVGVRRRCRPEVCSRMLPCCCLAALFCSAHASCILVPMEHSARAAEQVPRCATALEQCLAGCPIPLASTEHLTASQTSAASKLGVGDGRNSESPLYAHAKRRRPSLLGAAALQQCLAVDASADTFHLRVEVSTINTTSAYQTTPPTARPTPSKPPPNTAVTTVFSKTSLRRHDLPQ